jgi:hypothetical protein
MGYHRIVRSYFLLALCLGVIAANRPTSDVRFAIGSAQSGGLCVPPSIIDINDMQDIVASNDSAFGIGNRSLAHLPQIDTSLITPVMDTAKCRRASLASGRAKTVRDTVHLKPMEVIAVGPTRYVAIDTSAHVGEFMGRLTLDSTFATIALWSH